MHQNPKPASAGWKATKRLTLPRHRLIAGSDDVDDPRRDEEPGSPLPTAGEDLPYKVELWDAEKKTVEVVLAITANSSIGFAAYYAATREFPDRFITLRHKGGVLSRWNGPVH